MTFCSTKSSVMPSALRRRIKANSSSTRSGDSPSEGSSRMSSRGSAIKPLPIASICCSPPDKSRKDREHALAILDAPGAGAAIAAEIEIFRDREVRKYAAPFRHVNKPTPDDCSRRLALDGAAGEMDGAARCAK